MDRPFTRSDTLTYAAFVARESGFVVDQPLDFHRAEHLGLVLVAMIRMENGRQPYTDAQIDAAARPHRGAVALPKTQGGSGRRDAMIA